MGHRDWIYHDTEQPKIIDSDEMESYKEDGWRESPAPFIKIADFDIDPDDSVGIQQLGDTVQGVTDALNGALNIDEMDKDQLEEYALENFGIDLDKRKNEDKLRDEVRAMIDGNSE
jgi:hypothetical protein